MRLRWLRDAPQEHQPGALLRVVFTEVGVSEIAWELIGGEFDERGRKKQLLALSLAERYILIGAHRALREERLDCAMKHDYLADLAIPQEEVFV